MNKVRIAVPIMFVVAVLITACQSTPPSDSTSAQPAAGDTKPVPASPPQETTPPQKSEPIPEAARVDTMSVSEMQKRLTELGYQPGPADGVSGKKTIDALKKFQQASGLPPTGKLDSETTRRLLNAKR